MSGVKNFRISSIVGVVVHGEEARFGRVTTGVVVWGDLGSGPNGMVVHRRQFDLKG